LAFIVLDEGVELVKKLLMNRPKYRAVHDALHLGNHDNRQGNTIMEQAGWVVDKVAPKLVLADNMLRIAGHATCNPKAKSIDQEISLFRCLNCRRQY
jgi:hypothetical protein